MSKSKTPKKPRRILRKVGITLGVLATFLLLFVVAFVFNPLEGTVRDVRDLVPRGVDFFVRKVNLAADFAEFPEPRFWSDFAASSSWQAFERGPLVTDLRRDGLDRALQQARDGLQQLRAGSAGFIDVLRDCIGTEVVVAGYELDYSKTPPAPLATPQWALYTRVTWRIKAIHGLLRWGVVQSQVQQPGVELYNDGEFIVVKAQGHSGPFYIGRHLDCLMIASDKPILERTQALIDGSLSEEPFGQMASYGAGVSERVRRWIGQNDAESANALEFYVAPNSFDGFRRKAATWPNAANPDSMNERVLASFLKLGGWNSLAGALLFHERRLSFTGEVVLNSNEHTPFQGNFFRAEKQQRRQWLDPFLAMVPESACAAAALRMPVNEFLQTMFGALEPDLKELLDNGMRRSTYQGTQLLGTRDLIDRLKGAFLPRTGFVFRRNVPDTERDPKTGELQVPVTALSPMPQVAWVFWLRDGSAPMLEEFVKMLRDSPQTFGFVKAYHLTVAQTLVEKVTELTNPQIPATGEIAFIVFREFVVMSNSGPLIKDILKTRNAYENARSIRSLPEFAEFDKDLVNEPNGFIWLYGPRLELVFDDYRAQIDMVSAAPNPDWMASARPAAEDHVRRQKYPQYGSKASMPRALVEGEFNDAVRERLQELWTKERTNFSAEDRAGIEQMKAMAQMVRAAYLQVELEPNYMRFQGRALFSFR